MSTTQPSDDGNSETDTEELDAEALQTQLAVLQEENSRLREEYARAHKVSYRRTAMALALVGLAAVAAGGLLVGVRDVLFTIGAIGFFGGVLTWYLTPERVLAATVSESIYAALAANGERLQDELGLQSTAVYLPSTDGVRLFLPQHRDFDIPDSVTTEFLTADESRGVTLTPSGQRLFNEFEQAQAGPASSHRELADQLGQAIVEQFEIADSVVVEESASDDRVVVTIEGAIFDSSMTFDHPAVSLVACGLAKHHDGPVAVKHIDETTVTFETDVPPLTG
jgi:hypothetical protein